MFKTAPMAVSFGAPAHSFKKPAQALLMMVAAHLCFSLMIALIKAAQLLQISNNASMPAEARFGTWESVLFRCLPMSLICLLIMLRRNAAGHGHPALQPSDLLWLVTRGIIGAASMACFFHGTLHIPIALASLFANSSVFIIGLLGHYFLSERLTHARALFATAGFAGVALVLGTGLLPHERSFASGGRPFDYFIAFCSGVLASVAYFSVRKMQKVPSNTIILSLSLSGVVLALLSGLIYAPLRIPSDPAVLALLCLSAVPAVAAQYLMTWSFQSAEAGFVALGQYTGPVFAAFLGIVAFDEKLTLLQWTGAGLSILFGVLMPLLDERLRRREVPPVH